MWYLMNETIVVVYMYFVAMIRWMFMNAAYSYTITDRHDIAHIVESGFIQPYLPYHHV
jgi:hypothetical protein